MTISVGV